MSADYEPGTVAVATVAGAEGVRISRYDGGWVRLDDPDRFYNDVRSDQGRALVTDVRPLVVLDLTPAPEHLPRLLGLLRNNFWFDLADQIEAQTKPARIPEPGLWGVVEAHIDGEHGPQADYLWIHTRSGWETVASMQRARRWDDLIDPTLIREGLS